MLVNKRHILKGFEKTLHWRMEAKLYQFDLRAILVVFPPKFNAIVWFRAELWSNIWMGLFFAHPVSNQYKLLQSVYWRIVIWNCIYKIWLINKRLDLLFTYTNTYLLTSFCFLFFHKENSTVTNRALSLW